VKEVIASELSEHFEKVKSYVETMNGTVGDKIAAAKQILESIRHPENKLNSV
jgi:hypothetical protein